MATQDTNTTSLYIKEESTWGEAAASGTMVQFPYASCSVEPAKKTVVSEHIRTDRMRDDLAFIGESVTSSIGWELQPINVGGTNYMAHVLQGILANDFPAQTTATGVSVAAGKFHKTGITATLSIAAGDYFTMKGFTDPANNGLFRCTVAGTDDLTVAETLVTETTNGTVYFRKVANGTTKQSYLTEEVFSDITKYGYATGNRFETFGLDISAEQVIKCSATLTGKAETIAGASVGGTRTAAAAKGVLTASVNAATLLIDGSSIGVGVQSIKLNMKANTRSQPQVGSRYPRGVGMGFFEVDGELNLYFENTTLYTSAMSHSDVGLIIPITSTEAYGDGFAIELPRLKFGAPKKSKPGGNQDVFLTLPFTGLRHSTKSASCIVYAMGETA